MMKLFVFSATSILVLISGAAACATDVKIEASLPEIFPANEDRVLESIISEENINVDSPAMIEARRSLEQYQNALSTLRNEHGAYHSKIGQELLGLGLAYGNLGQHAEALKAFKESLHISRVNQGLHNPSQVPILEQMMETNTKLADWESLHKNYQLMYWVYRRHYGENDPRLLPVLDRFGKWHLRAYQQSSDTIPFRHLLNAELLYKHSVSIIETNYGQNDRRLVGALYGMALTNYQIASHVTHNAGFEEIRFSATYMGRKERMTEEAQIRQAFIFNSYRAGEKALLRIKDIYASNSDLPLNEHAMTLVHLGDWYQLFNKPSAAINIYVDAHDLLIQHETSQALINKLFGTPRKLPVLSSLFQARKDKKDEALHANRNYVMASFDVSKRGRPNNIQILESKPVDDKAAHQQAKRSLRRTSYRPRFENGKPVSTAGMNIRYLIDD